MSSEKVIHNTKFALMMTISILYTTGWILHYIFGVEFI